MSTDTACNDAPLFLEDELSALDTRFFEAWAAVERDDTATADHKESVHEAKNEVLTASDSSEVERYNSGASRHISPFRHQFTSYQSITPRTIFMANKRNFLAVGEG